MATLPAHHKKKTQSKKTANPSKALKPKLVVVPREIGAGEFKAKCLAIIDEVSKSGQEVIITKRGKAVAKLIPFQEMSVDSLFGRLKGIVEIVGDPDDLIKPAFPEEDWDMLK
jgi:prevent-host-death family protein